MKKLFIFLFFGFSVIAMEMPQKSGKREEKEEEKKIKTSVIKPIPSLKQQAWKVIEQKIIAELYPQLEESDLETIKEYLQDTTGKLLLSEEWSQEQINPDQVRDLA